MDTPNLHTRFLQSIWPYSTLLLIGVMLGSLFLSNSLSAQSTCNNVTDGGVIAGNEMGCPNPTFDPTPIVSLSPPSGGSGAIEYLWMRTTGDPNAPFNAWDIIPGAKGETYDPLPISVTTYYARCSRRALCTDYNGETNIISKTIQCCSFDVTINTTGGNTCDREVTLSAAAPQGSQYTWTSNGGTFNNPNSATPIFTSAVSGIFSVAVTVTSPDGCETTTSLPISLGSVTATTTVNHPTCGKNDGSVTATVTGGVSPLQYDWGDAYPNAPTISNLAAGVYIVIVTDANGCSSTATAELQATGNLAIDFTSNNVSCNEAADGSITIQPRDGIAPYTYQWANNISTTATASNLSAGAYQITVVDATGCSNVANITILENPPLAATITTNNSCDASNGVATVSVSGGTPGYTYIWNDPSSQTSSTATKLSNGTYTVTVTDAAGCTAIATTSIATNGLLISSNTTNTGCVGSSTGTATISVANGVAPYTYSWSNGGNSATITTLSEGTYIVTVSDAAGCSAISELVVNAETSFELVISTSDATCGENNGRAVVNVIGSDDPFTYRWNDSNNQISSAADKLAPGTYTVTVTAPNGCSLEGAAPIGTVSSNFSTSIDISNTTLCLGSITEVSAIITGNAQSYAWSATSGEFLNANSPNTSYISSLPGEHTITLFVTDANGCQATETVTVTVVNAFGGTITADKTGICIDDPYLDTVMVTLTGTSTARNTFIVTDKSDNIIGVQNSNQFNFESAGEEFVFIRNISFDSSISNSVTPGVNLASLTGCFGLSNPIRIDRYSGEACNVLCNVAGGDISTSDPTVVCVGDGIPNEINTVVAGSIGTYSTWVITDIHETVIAIPSAPPFDFNNTEVGICYIWHISSDRPLTNINIGSSLTNLPGCAVLSNNSIEVDRRRASPFNIIAGATTLCLEGATELATDWNTTFSSYSWTATNGTFTDGNSDRPIYFPDTPGTHTITVSIFDGVCTSTATTTILVQAPVTIDHTVANATCADDANGQINVIVSGGTAPYTYLWSDSSTTSEKKNVTMGVYDLLVTDALGCSNTISIPVVNESNLVAEVATQNINCFGDNTGGIVVTTNGGVAPYTYLWNGQPNNPSVANLSAGSYTIDIVDALGCTTALNTTLTEPEALTVTITTSHVTCQSFGAAEATVKGGVGPYQFQWNDGLSRTTSNIDNLAPGDYQVSVRDQNGCTAIATATILQESITNCQINVISPITTINGSEGHLQAAVEGGNSLKYLWSNGSTESSISNLSDGEYSVTITDAFGCSCEANAKLKNPAKIGDFVFEDSNDNGIQDVGEDGLRGVGITLSGLNEYGEEVVLNTLSDKNGMYMFLVVAGTYKITLTDFLNLKISTPNVGEDHLDSDIDPITAMSQEISVIGGEFFGDLDIGLVPKGFCDNVLSGGSIAEDEILCGPTAGPSRIFSVSKPTGGSGELQYLWLQSHKPDYTPGDPDWIEIPNSNEEFYQPDSIQSTTYYIRCTRRKGCDNYPGETNVIAKTVVNCAAIPTAEQLRVTPMAAEIMLEWDGNIPLTQSHFVIERSQDGVHFKTIGSAKAFQSDSYTAYDYMDKSPSIGENYYRIKTVHPNMGYAYSNTAMAMLKPTSKSVVTVYPNPAQEELTIHFLESRTEPAILEVANGFGQVIQQVTIDTDISKYQLSLQALPGGIYYLKFQNRTLKRYSQKILKRE